MSVYLGIDVGTQSIKALFYDAEKRCVAATASAALELISRDDGSREQLAEWWIAALRQCLLEIDAGLKQRVVAIGVSGQQHGFVPVAADGSILAPVKLWCDTATLAECEQITEAFGGTERCIAELGNPILPGYTASKIRWLKNHNPDAYRQLATVLLPHDYVNYYLTGERVMECGDASGTGLLDIRQRKWHAGMLHALDSSRDLTACLPVLVEPSAPVGQLRRQVAEQLGLTTALPVAAGGGDNMLAAIGTGNVNPGRLTISLGTSGTLFACSDSPVIDPQAQLAAFCSSTGGWLPLLCTMNCTVATELSRELFGIPVDELESNVSRAPAGSGGVLTLPFYNGERTPNLPHGKGCIMGLDAANNTAGNLIRSAMEGATYGLRAGLEAFVRLGCKVSEIRLTGGGARNSAWRQMVADVFELPVTILCQDEGAAMGAALQAMWMHGTAADLQTLVDDHLQVDASRSCQPEQTTVNIYQQHYQRYLRHVEAITPLYSRLSRS